MPNFVPSERNKHTHEDAFKAENEKIAFRKRYTPVTSLTLGSVKNDTGRSVYCGPAVVSALTGATVSQVEEAIHHYRWAYARGRANANHQVRSTNYGELRYAFRQWGVRLPMQSYEYKGVGAKAKPTFAEFCRLRGKADYVPFDVNDCLLVALSASTPHWVLLKGRKRVDAWSVHPIFLKESTKWRRSRVLDVTPLSLL